jgi:aryl-alcohol dehydrogenase-like predicted oxidoreductase
VEYTTLGRTGLRVSVAGFGTGGGSRLGMKTGKTAAQSVALIHAALDHGVNLIDTGQNYGTEPLVGTALKSVKRDSVVLCTKHHDIWMGERLAPDKVVAGLDRSLKDLGTDYVDVLYVHSVRPPHYDYTRAITVPALLREKEKGKFRFLGFTESGPPDPTHEMAARAIADDCIDVLMVAFSMLQQNARTIVFPGTRKLGIGVTCMYAVRNIFSFPGRLQQAMRQLANEGMVPAWLGDKTEPLDFLIQAGHALNTIDAAYRYVRHEPGVDVTLFGTGEIDHLKANIASLCRPPLPETDRARIAELFGHLVGVGMEYGEAGDKA